MKTKKTKPSTPSKSIIQSKDIAIILGVTAAILMIPLVAMQLSDEWNWNLFDFIIIGTLLVGTGFLITLAGRKIKNTNQRVAVIIALLIGLILTYIHLAVGIVDDWPFAGS